MASRSSTRMKIWLEHIKQKQEFKALALALAVAAVAAIAAAVVEVMVVEADAANTIGGQYDKKTRQKYWQTALE